MAAIRTALTNANVVNAAVCADTFDTLYGRGARSGVSNIVNLDATLRALSTVHLTSGWDNDGSQDAISTASTGTRLVQGTATAGQNATIVTTTRVNSRSGVTARTAVNVDMNFIVTGGSQLKIELAGGFVIATTQCFVIGNVLYAHDSAKVYYAVGTIAGDVLTVTNNEFVLKLIGSVIVDGINADADAE